MATLPATETSGSPTPHRIVSAEVPVEEIRGRIVRNPNYGGPTVSIYGWRWVPHEAFTHRKPGFQDALAKSIAEGGFRNPVIVYALPEGSFLGFGASRLRAAVSLGLHSIPAIVNDYANRFPDATEVTESNHAQFFTDPPVWFEITEHGADYHYSLERNRRNTYDPQGMKWTEELEDREFIAKEFSWITEGTRGTD